MSVACFLNFFLPAAAGAATLIVANASDAINGNVSSPTALAAEPGPDGISLREAILAVNAAPGPHEIGFSGDLLGQTIALSSPLPFLERDGTRIVGLRQASGGLRVTLDGSGITQCCGYSHMTIAASRVTVEGLRFTNVIPRNRALRVLVGPAFGQPSGPQSITDVSIVDNEFDNSPRTTDAYAVTIGADGGADTLVRGVNVARNIFRHFQGDATAVQIPLAGSERSLIENVAVQDNTFTDCAFAVELVNVMGSRNTIRGTRIERNLFERSLGGGVTLGNEGRLNEPPTSENVITQTMIAGNRFVAGPRWAIQVNGGYGTGPAIRNAITETWIVNNVITRAAQSGGGVLVLGGDVGGTENRVVGVHLLQNTIAYNDQVGLTAVNNPGGTGNLVANLEIHNNIFWMNQPDFGREIQPRQVHYSLTSQPGFSGVNGNIDVDPRFADPQSGDFHLLPGSPAIDAGTSEGTARVDADSNGRVDDPSVPNTGAGVLPFVDLGAFEHVPVAGGAPCVPAVSALCLNSSRFRAEIDWGTAQGAVGAGQAVALTADTGYLWFFHPANVEVMVKVLNGCGLNQRYWVFAAGLTNVEAVLTVTDTRSAAARQYSNPQGTPFQPIQDTDVFATCP